MARDYQSERSNWRSDNERSNRWRDENEGRYGGDDRDYDYRYTRGDEGDSSVRAGSYDQGRVQYGRRDPREQRGRDTNEQSGSTSRYAGYGDFGQGNYGGNHRDSGQERYGQSGHGGRDFGGNYRGDFREGSGGGEANRRYGYESGYGRQGGYGGDFGRGRYGEGGSESRFERDAGRDRGSDYFGYGYGGQGYGGYGGAMGSQGSSAWRGHGAEGEYSAGWNASSGGGQYASGGDFSGTGYGARGAGLHRGKGPKGYQRSDERLQEMICERLREDPDIDASEISVNVQGGRVTLEGAVDSRRTKNLAEDVAEQLGVHDVQNNLRVQRQDTSGVQSSTLGTAQGTQARGGSTADPSKSKQH